MGSGHAVGLLPDSLLRIELGRSGALERLVGTMLGRSRRGSYWTGLGTGSTQIRWHDITIDLSYLLPHIVTPHYLLIEFRGHP